MVQDMDTWERCLFWGFGGNQVDIEVEEGCLMIINAFFECKC